MRTKGEDMKGIILAGGLGTRLFPLTKVTNKCLLPVYDKPMIYYPIQFLIDSGIDDILLVCGGNAAGEFLRVLGNGEDFGIKHLHYTYQKETSGIAHALGLAQEWADDEKMCVVLADNVLENPISEHVKDFQENGEGARIFVTPVDNPSAYGVVQRDKESGKVLNIEEKPKNPKSDEIAIGVYMYDPSVWEFIGRLKPSQRGELEITDLNNYYLQKGKLKAHPIDGGWYDCGENFDKYLESQCAVAKWNTK